MKTVAKFCSYAALLSLLGPSMELAHAHLGRSPATIECLAETLSPASPQVRQSTVTVQGRTLPVQIVPPSMMSKHDLSFTQADVREYGHSVDLSQLSPSYRHEVLFGVQGPQHFYLIVDGLRYDARILAPSTFVENSNAQTVGAGMVIHFGFNQSQVKTLKAEFSKPEKQVSLSCGQGILSKFAKLGISIPGQASIPFRPSEIIEKLLQNGLLMNDGTRVPFKLIQIGQKSVDVQIEGMKAMTRSMEPGMRRFLGNLTPAELEIKIKHPLSADAKESLRPAAGTI